jgi:hypothetical protein
LFEVSLDAETLGQPLDSPVADQPELFADLLEKAVPASLVGPERADPVQADPVHLAIKYSALTVDRQHRVIAVYERQLRRQAEETRQQPI